MRILKFGGKSLDSVEKVNSICKFIKKIYKDEKKIIIIVSAIGKTTDELLNKANSYNYNEKSKRELAILLSTGEIQSASLLSIKLNSMGIPSKSLNAKDINMLTYGDYLNSRVVFFDRNIIDSVLETGTIAVITGFQGVNSNGEYTILGRGGSDITAVAIASIYNIDAEIYSDFDGVFTGDPRINKFKKINKIDYNSMLKMANSGANVINNRAVQIAENYNINILSKSSNLYNKSGTIITAVEQDIVSISTKENLCKISIIFSNHNKFELIIKNVIKTLINFNFYNLTYNNSIIEFFIEQKDLLLITNEISRKLKIIK